MGERIAGRTSRPSTCGDRFDQERPSVCVAGAGMTTFESESDRSPAGLMEEAVTAAIDDSDVEPTEVDSVHVGNMAAESFNGRTGLANALIGSLGADGAVGERVENTSASGASAFLSAVQTIESGRSRVALVVGVEKMSGADTKTATEIISRLTHEREYAQGVTLPAFAGIAADEYLRRYDADRKALAGVAVKNHRNATDNPYAQFRRAITVEEVLESPEIAAPIRLYDCCPTSDGAAAVVLTVEEPPDRPVQVRGVAGAGGTHAVADRRDPLEIESVRTASRRAFEPSGLEPADVDVACIHDAFTILEWLELEEMGFYPSGEAWRATVAGETERDGEVAVNPGGGLKARGHPLGATGVSQIVELYWQLRGDAPGRSTVAGAAVGAAINVAGFGNNSVCTVLALDDD